MIYCVWYPSGGFGHFINAVLTLRGKNFVRPIQKQLKFSLNGHAHALDLVAPRYQNNYGNYKFDFDLNFNYSVLIDNGILNESEQFRQDFPDATVIKMCYSSFTWPIVSRTMIDKAMDSNLEQQVPVDFYSEDPTQPWAIREKYFLFLKEHTLSSSWRPSLWTHNLLVDDLLDYNVLYKKILNTGIQLDDFSDLWLQWRQANGVYIDPVVSAQEVINCVKNKQWRSLEDFDTHWSQAVLYYFLFLAFEREVPHNDYKDFFCNTDQIQEWLSR